MTKRGLLILSLVLMGCASNLPRGADVADAPCVPPGFPPLADWQPHHSRVAVSAMPDGRPVIITIIGYTVLGAEVSGIWLGPNLVQVLPDAHEASERLWFDTGLIDEAGRLRPGGSATCEWRRAEGETA